MSKIHREKAELIDALKKHLRLLKEYYERAFVKGDADFYGEIACKIRLLAIKGRSNKPLLIKLQNITGQNMKIAINKPSGSVQMTLSEYMNSFGCVIRNSDDQLMEFAKKDVIAIYAEQIGGCHEDWAIKDELFQMINSNIYINENPVVISLIGAVCRTILYTGEEFLKTISKEI